MAARRDSLGALGLCLAALVAGCGSAQPAGRVAQFDHSYRQGCGELAVGNATAAKAYFQDAAARRNDHALTHYYLGVCHAMLHEDDRALVGLGRAIRLDPTLAAGYYNIGTIHLRHRRFRQAAEALEKGVELDPNNVRAYNNLAKAYYMLALPEMAAEAYGNALALDAESRVALAGLCRLALAGGNMDGAKEHLARLEAVDPDAAEVLALKRLAARKSR